MRISSYQVHTQATNQLQTLGAQAASTQQQIAQGKRLVNPSDDRLTPASERTTAAGTRQRTTDLHQQNAILARAADLVLPATHILEEEDLVYSSMFSPYLNYSPITLGCGATTRGE